jgi:hypothetical protein
MERRAVTTAARGTLPPMEAYVRVLQRTLAIRAIDAS